MEQAIQEATDLTDVTDLSARLRLDMLLETLEDAVVEISLDKRILSWNRGAERTFGYTAAEVLGRPIDMLSPEERCGETDHIVESVRRGEAMHGMETVRRDREGKEIDVSLNVRPVRNRDGVIWSVLVIARDVSEYKRALARQHSLVNALIAAQEEERRRVAYDLHDGLTQFVMASHAHLETFRHAHESGDEGKARHEMEQGLRYLKEAIVESRRLVNGLRALSLDNMGLAAALEQLLAEEKVRAGWGEAYLVHNTGNRRFDKILGTAVFRVAQEALTNARKHAATSRVRMMLLEVRDEDHQAKFLSLEIRDWGQGFDTTQPVGAEDHVGLQSMVERVRLLDGTYTLQSAPGEGTVVRVSFPLRS
jgi:PAS domain S-box-containing protein